MVRGLALALGLIALPVAVSAAPFDFNANLTGSQQNPPVTTTGSGTASAVLDGAAGSWVLTYTLNFSGLTSPIALPGTLDSPAHIHNAPIGSNGGVVHDLDGAASLVGLTGGSITGDWRFDDAERPLTDALAQSLLGGDAYFNIHTAAFPSGEIRGQILVADGGGGNGGGNGSVPVPGSLAMMLAGIAGWGTMRLRQRAAGTGAQ